MRAPPRPFLVFLLTRLAAAGPVWAQAVGPDSLPNLLALRTITDLSALRRAVDSVDHPPGGRVSRFSRTEAGFAYLMLANRTESFRDYRTALDRLEESVEKDPDWAPGWYALGQARLAMAEQGFTGKPGPGMVIGDSYADGAANAFLEALKLDPGYIPAAGALAGMIGKHDLRIKQERLRAALGQAILQAQANPGRLPEYARADLVLARAWLAAGKGDTAGAMNQIHQFRQAEGDTILSLRSLSDLGAVLLTQSQLELSRGLPDSALITLASYLRAGGDSAIGRHEQARTLFALGQAQLAESIYFLGARDIRDGVGRSWYRFQIHWIARPGEMASFDSLPLEGVEPWLRTFWGLRDTEDGRRNGSRLAEHFRRWEYALSHYAPQRRFAPRGAGWSYLSPPAEEVAQGFRTAAATANRNEGGGYGFDPWRYPFRESGSDDPTLDDRGAVYMRLGEPDRRATYPRFEQAYADSWLYVGADGGTHVFHFTDVPFDGVIAPARLSVFPAGDLDEACKLEHRICRFAIARALGGRPPGPEQIQGQIQAQRSDIRAAFRSDGFPPRYRLALDPVVQLYGLPATSSAGSRILAVFALPRAEIGAGEAVGGRAAYRIGFRLSAIPTNGDLEQLDTVRTFVADTPATKGQMLSGVMELPVPARTYLVTFAITARADSAGSLSRLPDLAVPRLGEDSLGLAALLLGRAESSLRVYHGGEEIRLNPGNVYRPTDPAEVYYFVSGMIRGRDYQTTIELRRKKNSLLTIRFAESGEPGIRMVRRSLDLSQIRPGSYLLVVRITDPATGAGASQEQRLNVVK